MPKSLKAAPPPTRKNEAAPRRRKRPGLTTHDFTLVYPGFLEDFSDADLDALYEAGCADALVGSCEGEITIDFGRKAPSYLAALLSAIHDVEKAGLGLTLIRVESSS